MFVASALQLGGPVARTDATVNRAISAVAVAAALLLAGSAAPTARLVILGISASSREAPGDTAAARI